MLQLIRHVADEVINPRFRDLDTDDISEKNPGDLVTVADHEAEHLLTKALNEAYPTRWCSARRRTPATPTC